MNKELNIGDYVRTVKGEIYHIEHDEILKFLSKSNYHKIIKSSPNIIDLIEVGDYVNGYKVSYSNGFYQYWDDMFDKNTIETGKDIKSIVTREMFESMEYKIGE